MARPSKYTPEIAKKICERLSHGESLRRICLDEDIPTYQTFYNWCHADEALFEQYMHAKERSATADADRIDRLAEEVVDKEVDPQVGKVAFEMIKWSAAVKRPKQFGDYKRTESTHTVKEMRELSKDELREIIATESGK